MDLIEMGHIRERTSREDHALTTAGRKQLKKEAEQWQAAASIVERFLKISESSS